MSDSEGRANPRRRANAANPKGKVWPTNKTVKKAARKRGDVALARLVSAGNRPGRRRLVGIAAGIAVGVALLLMLVGAYSGFGPRSERAVTGSVVKSNVELKENSALGPGRAGAAVMNDHWRGSHYSILYVAGVAESGLTIPGASALPGPGQAVVSPRLKQMIDASPDELGGRYGRVIGTISKEGLESPEAITAVVGTTAPKLAASGLDAKIVEDFAGVDYAGRPYKAIALIGAVATLVPVLLLIAIVTDLGASQRAERFAALRLIGATPRRVAAVAAWETGAVAGVGALAGIALYFAAVPLAARIKVGAGRFYNDDLLVSPGRIAGIAVVTVACAAAVAWRRTLHTDVGPLGQSREPAERPPRAAALLPLALGLGCLGCAVASARSGARPSTPLIVVGFLLTALGLIAAGPFVTRQLARVGMRRAGKASTVIAFNRIARFPKASFRTVSGMAVAAYTVTVFAVGVTAAAGVRTVTDGPGRLPTSIIAVFSGKAEDRAVERLREELANEPGVRAVAVGRLGGAGKVGALGDRSAAADQKVILSSAQARALGVAGPQRSEYVALNIGAVLLNDPLDVEEAAGGMQTRSDVRAIMVRTDGRPATVERVRTRALAGEIPLSASPASRADLAAEGVLAPENQFAAIAYVGIVIAALLSAVSLTVSAISSVIQRRRAFGLMRLTGMPRAALRKVVSIEAIAPVAAVFLACLAAGAFTAWAVVITASEGKRTVGSPSLGFYVVLAFCFALTACSTAATVKAAFRVTGEGSVRFE